MRVFRVVSQPSLSQATGFLAFAVIAVKHEQQILLNEFAHSSLEFAGLWRLHVAPFFRSRGMKPHTVPRGLEPHSNIRTTNEGCSAQEPEMLHDVLARLL